MWAAGHVQSVGAEAVVKPRAIVETVPERNPVGSDGGGGTSTPAGNGYGISSVVGLPKRRLESRISRTANRRRRLLA